MAVVVKTLCVGEVRNALLEFEMGLCSSNLVRKITPVTTTPQPQLQSVDDSNQLPLQVVVSPALSLTVTVGVFITVSVCN